MDLATIGFRADTSGINRAEKGLDDLAKQGGRTESSLNSLQKTVGVVSAALAGLGVAAALKGAIQTTANFSQAIADLSAITGAAGADLKFYREQAAEIGRTTTLSASQAAEAFKLIASAKPDLLASASGLAAVTKEAVALAEATGSDLPSAAKALGTSLNQFQLDAAKSSEVINILAASSKFGTAEVASVTESLKNAGSAANSLGVDLAETVAGIQALAAAGIQGAEAGTALRQVMLILEKSGDSGLQPSLVGISAAMEELSRRSLSNVQLMEMFGQEAFSAASSLLAQKDVLSGLNVSLRGTETAYEQAAIRVDTFNGDLKALNSAIEALQIKAMSDDVDGLGRSFLQASTGGINALAANLHAVKDAAIAVAAVMGLNLATSLVSATAATVGKIRADLASAAAAKAATVAELELAAATAAQATTSAAASVASAKESVQRLAATQASLVAEMNLEKVRMSAQISEIGRIQTATRMAEIGAARVAVTAQLTAAEARLAAATTASVAAEAGQVAALSAVSAAQAKTTITATALGAAWRFMLGPWGLLITALGVGAAAFMTSANSADEFTAATKNASDAVDELGNKLDNTNRIYANYMASQKAATASALSGLGQAELQAEFDKSSRRIEIYNDQLEKLIKSSASFARIESVRQKLANEKIALEELLKLMPTAKTSYEMLSDSAQKLIDRLDPATAANRTYAAEMKLLDDAVGKNIITTAQYTKLVEALKFEHAGGEKAIDEYRKAIEKLDERMQDHYDGLEILKEIEGDRISQLEESADAAYEWENRTVEGVEKVATLSEKAAERIESAFADAWMNAFDGMNSVVDGMKNAFKRMLAEMAHMALTKPIMVQIGNMLPSGGFADAFKAMGAGSSSGGIGGMSGILGSISAFAGPALAIASLGSMLSKALGGTGKNGALFGGLTGGLLGSWKTESDTLGLGVSGGDVTGSQTTTNVKKKFFKNRRETFTSDYDASALDSAFDMITASLSEAARTFGITSADEVIKGFSAAINIDLKGKTQEQIDAAINEWFASTTDALTSAIFGDSLSGLQKEGESVVDTVNRLALNMNVVSAVTKSLGLGFDLTGKSAMVAATNIVELAGGIDQLAALSNQYYQAFYSETERQLMLQQQLAEEFAKLNTTVPATRDEFRAMVDSLDLTTTAGQAQFAALMKLVPGMDQYLTAIEAQTAASQQAADAAKKEAEAKAAALKASQSGLELRLMDALGQSSEALAVRRQMELDATDASLHALLRSIYTAEDAAAAQRELASAQTSAASSARSAAQDAFSKLKDTASAEKDRLKTELDLKLETIDKERSALESQRDSVIDGYSEQSKAVEQYVSRLEGLNGVINGFLASTGAAVDPFKRLTQIFNEAKVGLLPDQSELQSVLSGISSAGSSGFGSAFEQQRAMAIARSQASGIGGMVGGQLSGARSQLSLIQQQVTEASKYYDDQLAKLDTAAEQAQKLHDVQVGKIDAQLTEAEKQYNALMGIDDRILTMEQALNEFNNALAATGEATLAVEIQQVEAINRVETAIVNMGAQLIEMSKPEDRIWLPPIEAPKPPFEGEPVTREMVDLLKELVAASDATAKHTKKAADELELTRYETLEP